MADDTIIHDSEDGEKKRLVEGSKTKVNFILDETLVEKELAKSEE